VPLSDGRQVRDFIAVDDVVDAQLAAGEAMQAGGGETRQAVWNVCTGEPVSVRDFAQTVAAVLRADPDLLGFGDIPRREDDVPWLVGCRELIEQELGWRPRLDLRAGLCRALEATGEC
jgi:GDP-4-dehydro-6-deoxy-D-mannose reductase